MLEDIILELGAYYSDEDENMLTNILDEVTANALSFSNQADESVLSLEIKQCVKSLYLRRGTEHDNSLNANGESASYIDAINELRNNIVKNGKRKVY